MINNPIDALIAIGTKAKLETRNEKICKAHHQAELEEQAALIEWADKTVVDGINIGDYLLHIPNEGKRGPKAARDAKRLGVRSGVPDLLLALPRSEYAGLWIEMKAKDGKLTKLQEQWLNRLDYAGYRAVCCYGFKQAIDVINTYLALRGWHEPNRN